MNHKISQLCDKIDNLQRMSNELRRMKYEQVTDTSHINHQIDLIRLECLLIANDKQEYNKDEPRDPSQ